MECNQSYDGMKIITMKSCMSNLIVDDKHKVYIGLIWTSSGLRI